MRSKLEPVKNVVKMLRRHEEGLLNVSQHKISNACAEGYNSAIQVNEEHRPKRAQYQDPGNQTAHYVLPDRRSPQRAGNIPGVPAQCLKTLTQKVIDVLLAKPTTSSREAVVGQLLHRWISGAEPVTTSELAQLSGASLPTVYAALKTIDARCLQRDESRRVFLSGFTAEAWQKWLTLSTDAPSAKFVDRSGAPRSPEKLARELAKLQRSDLAVGGCLARCTIFRRLTSRVRHIWISSCMAAHRLICPSLLSWTLDLSATIRHAGLPM